MLIHTLTHNLISYGLIILVMLCISIFPLSAQIFRKFNNDRKINFMTLTAVVMILAIIYGSIFIPINNLFSGQLIVEIFAIIFGIGFGCFVFKLDKLVSLKFKAFNNNKKNGNFLSVIEDDKSIIKILSLTSKKRNNTEFFNDRKFATGKINNSTIDLILLLIIAITEEIIFRGFFVFIALNYLHGLPKIILLLLSVIIFGLSHKKSGRYQIFLKGSHGLLFLLATLFFHTLTAAIIAHAILNISVLNFNRRNLNYKWMGIISYEY